MKLNERLTIGIIVPSNNQSGAQKLAALCSIDLACHGHDVHLFIPRLPYYYYLVTLGKKPFEWLRLVRHYIIGFIRNRRFCYDDLIQTSSANHRIHIRNILRHPSKLQVSELDCLLVMTIAQVVEVQKIYPEEKIIYQLHHPEELVCGFPDVFRSVRSNFKGRIIAISPWTAQQVVDHIPEPAVVPDAVSTTFWDHNDELVQKQRDIDILFHYSLAGHKGAEVGEKLISMISKLRPQTRVTIWCRDGLPSTIVGNVVKKISEKELCNLYYTHKMLLFPSTFEGFGLPPIEALACGCIPILYPRIGATDLYARDGENSIFIDDDLENTAARISKLLDDQNRLESMRNLSSKRLEPFNPEGYGIRLLSAAGINVCNQ